MTVNVLLVGEEKLRLVSEKVVDVRQSDFLDESTLLHTALDEFRKQHGFGRYFFFEQIKINIRAISAPQIGVNKRFIAMNLGKTPFLVINPVITWKSDELFTLW